MEKVRYTRQEYRKEYLHSIEWKALRETIMQTGPMCQVCNKDKASDVHHMVYRNLVDIRISDLLPICRKCHDLIHQAIRDGYISQREDAIEEISRRTKNILCDKNYDALHKWLEDKHYLSEQEVETILSLQPFVIKKIAGLVKRNIYKHNIRNEKFTGRQIKEIRKIIKVGLYRRKHKLDRKPKERKFLLTKPKKDI